MVVMALVIVVSCFPLMAAMLLYSCRRLAPLMKSNTNVYLSFSPTNLNRVEIGFVLLLFLFRSLSHSLSTLWKQVTCQMIPSEPVGSATDHAINLTMPLKTTQHDLINFVKAVHPESSDSFQWNSVQLALLLSAWTEPAMLLLLATRNCKVRPLGAVNVRNRLELLRPDLCKPDALGVFENATLSASYPKTVRRVKRGLEVDLIVSLNVSDSQGGSQSATAFRQVFTILQFTKPDSDTLVASSTDQSTPPWPRTVHASFSVQHREPSSWAKVCKDYNPIHTSTLAAKMFGFPGKLAHGNHVVAKAFLALNTTGQLQDNISLSPTLEPSWIEVSFRRPVILPAKLDVLCEMDNPPHNHTQTTNFQVVSKDKLRIEGTVGILERTA